MFSKCNRFQKITQEHMLVGQHAKILLVTFRFLNTKRAAVPQDSGLVPPCLSFPIQKTHVEN